MTDAFEVATSAAAPPAIRKNDGTGKLHFPPLDGLRGLAVLMVIVVHAYRYSGIASAGILLGRFASAGWIGVTLFFVLSGFLISGILFDTSGKPHYLRDFYGRRSLRIIPLYSAFLLCYFFVVPHVEFLASRLPQPGSQVPYWSYLTNMKDFLFPSAASAEPIDPLWSLAVEEQVYLFWPLVILLVPRRRFCHFLLATVVASFAWRFGTRAAAASVESSYAWTFSNLEAFAAGAAVAWGTRYAPATLHRLARLVLPAAGGIVAGMWIGQRHFSFWLGPLQMLTVGMSAAIWMFAALIGVIITTPATTRLNAMLSLKALRLTGRYSYSMYLVHAPLIALLLPTVVQYGPSEGMGQVGLAVMFVFIIAASAFAVASLTWHGLEKHCLRLKWLFPLSSDAVVRVMPTNDAKESLPASGGVTSQI